MRFTVSATFCAVMVAIAGSVRLCTGVSVTRSAAGSAVIFTLWSLTAESGLAGFGFCAARELAAKKDANRTKFVRMDRRI
jgi:hypothetical protein